MLDRKDWTLLFLGLPGGLYPVDQIRVMKGLFLWSQQGPKAVRSLFEFSPYSYGPFDSWVYRDLETLEEGGLLRIESSPGTRQKQFSLTGLGEQEYADLEARASAKDIAQLRDIKEHVTSLGFAALLRSVYAQYPAYAARSVAIV